MHSWLPLSISSMEAVPYFRLRRRDRRMAKTDAASVEPSTEPINIPSSSEGPSARWRNSPVRQAVIGTPNVLSRMDLAATGLAVLHLVPNPP